MRRYVFLIFFIFVFLLVLLVFIKRISLGDVTCTSQYGVCADKVVELIESGKSQKLMASKVKISQGLEGSSLVSNYSVRYKIPNKLEVSVIENKPDFAFIFDGEEEYTLVSENGDIMAKASDTQLPKLLVKDKSTSKEEILFAGQILTTLFRYYNLRLGTIDDNTLNLEIDGKPEMIFPLSGDVDVLLGSMTLTLSWLNSGQGESKIEGDAHKIDFRYKNPVVQ